jgi:hypothetical protein
MNKLKRATFSWEGVGSYVGYTVDSAYAHSRWDTPLFPIKTAIQILIDSSEIESFEYIKESASLKVKTQWNEPDAPFDFVNGVQSETEDGRLTLYPIMDGWCWNVEDEAIEAD